HRKSLFGADRKIAWVGPGSQLKYPARSRRLGGSPVRGASGAKWGGGASLELWGSSSYAVRVLGKAHLCSTAPARSCGAREQEASGPSSGPVERRGGSSQGGYRRQRHSVEFSEAEWVAVARVDSCPERPRTGRPSRQTSSSTPRSGTRPNAPRLKQRLRPTSTTTRISSLDSRSSSPRASPLCPAGPRPAWGEARSDPRASVPIFRSSPTPGTPRHAAYRSRTSLGAPFPPPRPAKPLQAGRRRPPQRRDTSRGNFY